jgi:hypothetical protein
VVRIFTTLAVFAVFMVGSALALGLYLGDIHGIRDPEILRWATVHRLLGLAAALTVVLVDCISMTYFIGTGRWCKEVVDTYHLPNEFLAKSVKLKRQAFPWAIMSALAVVAVGSLGAAADPGTLRHGTEAWVNIHLIGAFLGITFIAIAFFIQGLRIAAHHQAIDDIVAEVRRIRIERGLEV